jgi:hypothetical protein
VTAPESITRDELADALRGLKITPEDENTFYPAVADAIFGHVKRHRESRHKPGAYGDAEGNLYMRVPGLNAWLRVMDDGTTEVRPDDWVERPLRKLVPEGPQGAKPSHFDVLAEIVTGLGHDETDKQLAARICNLLEVSDG